MGYIVFSYPNSCSPGVSGCDFVWKEGIWKCLGFHETNYPELGTISKSQALDPTEGERAQQSIKEREESDIKIELTSKGSPGVTRSWKQPLNKWIHKYINKWNKIERQRDQGLGAILIFIFLVSRIMGEISACSSHLFFFFFVLFFFMTTTEY